jgi:hypothetical protein
VLLYSPVHGSKDTALESGSGLVRLEPLQEIEYFFGAGRAGASGESTGESMGTTLGIIKPHALAARQAGAILGEICRPFELRALELFNVEQGMASEFFEVYRGVLAPSEFTGMVDQLTSGPCIVVELASKCAPRPLPTHSSVAVLSFAPEQRSPRTVWGSLEPHSTLPSMMQLLGHQARWSRAWLPSSIT